MSTIPRIPREEAVEEIFSKILRSPGACARLSEVFYDHLDDDDLVPDSDPEHFVRVLFSAYENQDISALLLEICQRSMFDLLREAYLIPKRFHGKAGMNPRLLTKPDGTLSDMPLKPGEKEVARKDMQKLQELRERHSCPPVSNLYLADGYDIVRSYTKELLIEEKLSNCRRGILALYALPDTASIGMSEAEAYAIIWEAFCEIQRIAPSAIVYYGQDTGSRADGNFDELGILLPMREFEKQMLNQIEKIDGIVLSCRERMSSRPTKDAEK